MKEIDQKLRQWIKNRSIRTEVRAVIIKEIKRSFELGYEAAHDEVRAD
tara:strand:- start:377 stop:520 length:144 start_codon:yes stop_codon:yes gene_type:complete